MDALDAGAPPAPGRGRWVLPVALAAGLPLAIWLPASGLVNPYVDLVLKYVGINIILTVSLNLVNGYMGEFSVGHAGFMAIGAYVASILTVWVFPAGAAGPILFPVALLAGGAGAGVAGLALAIPSFRTRGDYLAIVTLAFNMIVKSLIENLDVVGGPRGFMGMDKLTSLAWVYVCVVLTVCLARNFVYSRFGRGVLALREDETASGLVGVNTRQVKVLTFVFSAALAGLAGGLFAHELQFINPRSFTILKSTDMLVMVYLGGIGSLGGSILGATVYTVGLEGLRGVLQQVGIPQEWRLVVAPLLLILLMIYRPNGIMGLKEWGFLVPRAGGRRRGAALAPTEPGSAPTASAAPDPTAGPHAGAPVLLSIDHVTHRFGGLKALDSLNLDLREGELAGIIGPNGAGKTTVFNLVSGVYPPSDGTIRFRGRSLTGLATHEIAALGIARTFQNIRLFKDLSVLDNVRIALYARGRYSPLSAWLRLGRFRSEENRLYSRSIELLETLGLAGSAETIARNLPYGQQRRLEIARALATGPSLLLLDEPAAGMNPAEIDELMALVQRIRRDFGLTILLIEHQMRVVMGIAERILVLNFGVTIAEGSPAEIQNHPQVIEAYLGKEEGS